MTDGQPLKERRRAEKAELFQKGREREGISRRKRKNMLTEEGRLGFILMQETYVLYCDRQIFLRAFFDGARVSFEQSFI